MSIKAVSIYINLCLTVIFLFAHTPAKAQKISSLETLEQTDMVLLISEQKHLANVKAVTLADSILNLDLKDVIDTVKPQFFIISSDTINLDIGHQITYDSKFGDLIIRFDSAFRILKPFDYSIIPCYVYKDGRSCSFISESEAISVAKKAFKHKKVIGLKAYLEYDYTHRKYLYRITKKINPKENKAEVIVVDSETGKIISQKVVAYDVNQNGLGTKCVD